MEVLNDVLLRYDDFAEQRISGRYITLSKILPVIDSYTFPFRKTLLGESENGLSIYGYQFGEGKKRVLIWSQMHGNEGTTTKAIIDFFSLLDKNKAIREQLFEIHSFFVIPVLNPDGAELYTRENFNKVDLNRDAKAKTQKESIILHDAFEQFAPALCLNMHDQRTFYTVGTTPKTAAVSFLAPAADTKKKITESRKKAMKYVVHMRNVLETIIPGQIGRYDDTFNDNCFGDAFQAKGAITILFEAGHIIDDYQREKSRKNIFTALLSLFLFGKGRSAFLDHFEYFNIPENTKNFRDILIKNVKNEEGVFEDVLIQFEEKLENEKISFIPVVESIGRFPEIIANTTIDVQLKPLVFTNASKLHEGQILSEFIV
jgi:hypothetical protein